MTATDACRGSVYPNRPAIAKKEPPSTRELHSPAVTTNVYVDGFNLYNGCIKGGPYKWLDLRAFAEALLGKAHEVGTVRYFTARVIDSRRDPRQSQRQDVFLRALEAHSEVVVHLGQFTTHKKRVRLVHRRADGSWFDEAWVREEKGSDVNLAAHLLWDACHDRDMTAALVVSNDSDLQEAIDDMARRLDKYMVTANPHRHKGQSDHLLGDERRLIAVRHLGRSQLPEQVADAVGRTYRKPARWS